MAEEGCVGGGDGEGWWCGGGDEGIEVWQMRLQHGRGAGEEGEGFSVGGKNGVGARNCETSRFCQQCIDGSREMRDLLESTEVFVLCFQLL